MLSVLRKAVQVVLLCAPLATAQVLTGNYPYGTFDNKGVDTINVGSLNVHLAIPIVQKAGRGIPFYYTLVYDSSIWQPAGSSGYAYWQPVQNWGWLGQTVITTGYVSYSTHTYVCDWPLPKHGSYYVYYNFVYHDTFGVSHGFGGETEYDPTGCDSTQTGFSSGTLDGSGLTLIVGATRGIPNSATITTPGGVQTTAPFSPAASGSTVTDTNGNQISVSSSGVYTDTTNVAVMSVTGQAPNPVTLTYPTPTGPASATMVYGNYTVQTAFGCSSVSEYSATSVPLVSEIDLPDSSKYLFTYETTPNNPSAVTGRIASVTLPAGGTITYTYSGGNNGIECSDGSTAGLTRVLSNDPAGSTWTYSRTPGTDTSHTDVTDGLKNHSAYDFVLAGSQQGEYYETNRAIYQGAASGTPLLSRQTCYNGNTPSCTSTLFTMPISQIDTYETLDGIQTHGTTAKYNTNGMQTEADVYDDGGSSRGALLEKEIWTYGYYIASVATEDDLYDGAGNMAGKTVYQYDITGTTSTSGVPQHIAAGNIRGNLDQVLSYYNSQSALGSANISYADTGSPLTVSTPNGLTSYSYDSTQAYVTGTTLPTPSSGVSLQNSASYDTANSGVIQSSTDANGAVTSVPSYDSMLRPLEIDFPDGGKTTYSYSPTQTSVYQYQNSGTSQETETQYDGYGRTSRTAKANGQSGNSWYQQDTCYDANGNVNFTSYVYQGVGFSLGKMCQGYGDAYSYDALGRVTRVSRANGETTTYTYTGRAVLSRDQNGVSRIMQVDGLGRTTIVCELSTNGNMPGSGSPAGCGTDISGTGFTTNYTYDVANHKTTISQGIQTRVFQTDWLGRPILVSEPESGITTYSYNYSGDELVVTRVRPMANQTDPSVHTTTTTRYDSLGRVVSITYSDGTPTKTFAYDAAAGSGWEDLPQANMKGRLSLASVSGAGTAYSYDAMGRVNYLDECLPSGCGNAGYNHQLHYTYDSAGNLLSSTDGGGVQSTYAISTAGEVQSITSSLSNSTNPAMLIASVQNGPNGPLSWTWGNKLKGAYNYDVLGRVSGGGVCSDGNQIYAFGAAWSGFQLKGASDSVLGQSANYGYDEFDRLTSRTITGGTPLDFTYTYDRWGNRTAQTVTTQGGSGPQPSVSINTSTNQISSGGFGYDAAGNMASDGIHSYTYDADGNVTAVDGGATATYVYDALNRRVRSVVGGAVMEYVFNRDGQRVSEWDGSSHAQLKGKYYWGAQPVAYYNPNGSVHFEHQDWLGTERVRTAYNGSVEGTFSSLPFGDGQSASGSDSDANHFAALDHDSESGTEHAQFRQYSNAQGRWLAPDPYAGSYDLSNPQSFNRYTYASNQPLSLVDVQGLDDDDPCSGGYKSAVARSRGRALDDPDPCSILAPSGGGPPETPAPPNCDDDNTACVTGTPPPPPDPGDPDPITIGTLLPVSYGAGGAPSNETTNSTCQATLLNMANQQLGTNFNSSNIAGSYTNGTAYNIIIQSNQLTAAQFNNIQQGRYTTSGWQYLTGVGLAGHIADETNLGFAQSAFQSSNIGGNYSVSFAFHDDHGYANNPIGALIHWITDVLGHNTRKPC